MCLASANTFISKELYKFNDSAGNGYFDSFRFNGVFLNRTHGLLNHGVIANDRIEEISNAAEKAFISIHIYPEGKAEHAIGQKIDPFHVDNLQIKITSNDVRKTKYAAPTNETVSELSILLDEQAYKELMRANNFPAVDIRRLHGDLNIFDMGLLHKTLLHLINLPYPMNQFEYLALQGYCYAAIGEIFNRSLNANVAAVPCKLGAAERVKLLIDSDVKINQTIRQLANASGTNECYLKKEFKTLTGCSIMDYRQRMRMQYAKVLMSQGEQNIDVLATKVGYQNTAHFIRIFQRHLGVHPKEYQILGEQAR